MKKTLMAAGFAALLGSTAMAQDIGVSMALFDDNFLTVLRNGMIETAGTMDGVNLQVEDAQNDVAKQLDQINNFIASGVAAIIVNPVDTSATQAMSDAAAAAVENPKKKKSLKIILKVANQNNVQLFITTHNNEFLRTFKEVLEEDDFKNYQEETKCFSLKKLPKGNIKAYNYNFDEFEFAIEQENELR